MTTKAMGGGRSKPRLTLIQIYFFKTSQGYALRPQFILLPPHGNKREHGVAARGIPPPSSRLSLRAYRYLSHSFVHAHVRATFIACAQFAPSRCSSLSPCHRQCFRRGRLFTYGLHAWSIIKRIGANAVDTSPSRALLPRRRRCRRRCRPAVVQFRRRRAGCGPHTRRTARWRRGRRQRT